VGGYVHILVAVAANLTGPGILTAILGGTELGPSEALELLQVYLMGLPLAFSVTLITVGYLAGWPQFKGSWGVGLAGVILLAALVVGNRFSLGVAPVAVLQPIPYKG